MKKYYWIILFGIIISLGLATQLTAATVQDIAGFYSVTSQIKFNVKGLGKDVSTDSGLLSLYTNRTFVLGDAEGRFSLDPKGKKILPVIEGDDLDDLESVLAKGVAGLIKEKEGITVALGDITCEIQAVKISPIKIDKKTNLPTGKVKVKIKGIASADVPGEGLKQGKFSFQGKFTIQQKEEGGGASAVITPQGGEVSTIGIDGAQFTLTVPPGALGYSVEISLTPEIALDDLPISEGVLGAVQIGPAGLLFMNSVMLEITLTNSDGTGLTGFVLQNNGESFHLYPTESSESVAPAKFIPLREGKKGAAFELARTGTYGILSDICHMIPSLTAAAEAVADPLDRLNHLIELFYKIIDPCGAEEPFDLRDEAAALLYDAYFGKNGVLDLVKKVESDPVNCSDPFPKAVSTAANKIAEFIKVYDLFGFTHGKYPITPPIHCVYKGGTVCSDLDHLANAGVQSLFNAIESAIDNANKNCLLGDPSKECIVCKYLTAAQFMTMNFGGTMVGDPAQVLEQLYQLKTCGIDTLEIDPTEATVKVGESMPFQAIARDINGIELSDRDIGWILFSGASHISLSDDGLVTGQSKGQAVIQAADRNCQLLPLIANADICIRKPVAKVAMPSSFRVCRFPNSVPITPLPYDDEGDLIGLTDCPVQFTWSSDNPSIAEVDSTGVVTGKKSGATTIRAMSEDGVSGETRVGVIDIRGIWSGSQTVDETDCFEGKYTQDITFGVWQTGMTITIDFGKGRKFSTTRSCDGFSWSYAGYITEDGGIESGSGHADILDYGKRMKGSISWTWVEVGEDFACSGTTTFTANR